MNGVGDMSPWLPTVALIGKKLCLMEMDRRLSFICDAFWQSL